VGAKFRLSPKIDAQLSQRTEGRLRDKQAKNTDKKLEKDVTVETEKTPKAKQPKGKETKNTKADEVEKPTTRSVPYVDLPPKKVSKVTEPVNQPPPKEEPAYKNRAPVEVGLDIEKLVDTVMEMEVTVPLKSLAGVSNAIQKEIRKQVTKARMPVEERPAVKESKDVPVKILLNELKFESQVIEKDAVKDIAEGWIVAGDPVLQYIAQNENADLTQLCVGKMSEPLRSIYTRINGVGQEECLLDGGSMIVSMSKKVAVQLGLSWDPSIRIEMGSVTNHTERTLGVARNVAFEMGGLKLFLQVHILEDPPYRILLGKPFETLGATTIQTFEDGAAEVVVRDPNTKRVAVLPTYRRGESPDDLQKKKYQDF
jgi:hypothetical protein